MRQNGNWRDRSDKPTDFSVWYGCGGHVYNVSYRGKRPDWSDMHSTSQWAIFSRCVLNQWPADPSVTSALTTGPSYDLNAYRYVCMCVCVCVCVCVSMCMCAFVNGFDPGHSPDNLHLDRGDPQNHRPSPLIDSAICCLLFLKSSIMIWGKKDRSKLHTHA